MNTPTLALVQIENTDEVFTTLGEASLEIFLGEFEDRVREFARSKDEIIKIQPNKLCVLLNEVSDPLQIELAGAKLARFFEAPIQILDDEFKATVHAGFVPPDDKELDIKSRLRIAESALADARKSNQLFIVRSTVIKSKTVEAKRTREIELAFERGEFVMYFQPQIHSGFRNIIGAEGLMRWHHPQKGVRPPADFIPYADRSAVMRSLTWFAIKSSVAQAAEWPAETSVAVNVSPLLLHDRDLIPNVQDALAIFGLSANRLILEITEDAMLEKPDRTLSVLSQLSDLGVKISIDDFGTGYSSLAYFRDLPIDELKIDRSFVTDMLRRPKDQGLVKGIIDLAHNLGMKVVAEGVEDNATADALQQLGADQLQGYWFSKPIQSDAFKQLLT